MNLCSDGHYEICYDSKKCPLCEKQEEYNNLEKENEPLKDQIEELESQQ